MTSSTNGLFLIVITDSSIKLHHDFIMSRRDINAVLGIMGVYALGILLTWYPTGVLKIPLPEDLVLRSITNALWQTAAHIILPIIWIRYRLGFTFADLGISTHRLGQSIFMGCVLYSLALAAFMHCSGDQLISNHILRQTTTLETAGMLSGMSLIAAGTDIATRGYILLGLARYTHVSIAILVQNLFWYIGHINEINLLTGCLGFTVALGLTLVLGIFGDVIALRTRNVFGLAIAHIILNLSLGLYIRNL